MRFKEIKYLICIIVILVCLDANSQVVSSRLIREYPSSITRKVCSQLYSIRRDEPIQLWLADQYVWQDSLLQAAFISETNFNKFKLDRLTDSTNWLIEDRLIHQLNEKELALYKKARENDHPLAIPVYNGMAIMDAEMDSQFGKAIQFGNELQLKDAQYVSLFNFSNELRKKMIYAKAHADSGYFDRAAFESEKLSQVLSEKQYNDLLIAVNRDGCLQKAKYTWFDIKAAGLSKRFVEAKAIKNIQMYFMLREHITARYANEREKIAQMLGTLKMPEEMVALQDAKSATRAKLSKYAW